MAVENRLKSQTILAIPGPQKTQKSNLWKTENSEAVRSKCASDNPHVHSRDVHRFQKETHHAGVEMEIMERHQGLISFCSHDGIGRENTQAVPEDFYESPPCKRLAPALAPAQVS
jgi:hypothetical protein